MKKLLSILLALIFCLGTIVSCDNGEQTSTNEDESQSKLPSEPDDLSLYPIELDGVTAEYFDAYTAYFDSNNYSLGFDVDSIGIIAKAFFTYEDFIKGAWRESVFEIVNEQTFEDNFVVITQGVDGMGRPRDKYYTDFKQVDNYCTITLNFAYTRDQNFSQGYDYFADICIIPRSVCESTDLTEVKVVRKSYVFEGEIYNSKCTVRAILKE